MFLSSQSTNKVLSISIMQVYKKVRVTLHIILFAQPMLITFSMQDKI